MGQGLNGEYSFEMLSTLYRHVYPALESLVVK